MCLSRACFHPNNLGTAGYARRFEEKAAAEQQVSRTAAAAAAASLTEAVKDGRLTDDEIATAVGGPVWQVQRSASQWLLRARFDSTDPICFSYELTLPLGAGSRVASTELPSCPAITPGG